MLWILAVENVAKTVSKSSCVTEIERMDNFPRKGVQEIRETDGGKGG